MSRDQYLTDNTPWMNQFWEHIVNNSQSKLIYGCWYSNSRKKNLKGQWRLFTVRSKNFHWSRLAVAKRAIFPHFGAETDRKVSILHSFCLVPAIALLSDTFAKTLEVSVKIFIQLCLAKFWRVDLTETVQYCNKLSSKAASSVCIYCVLKLNLFKDVYRVFDRSDVERPCRPVPAKSTVVVVMKSNNSTIVQVHKQRNRPVVACLKIRVLEFNGTYLFVSLPCNFFERQNEPSGIPPGCKGLEYSPLIFWGHCRSVAFVNSMMYALFEVFYLLHRLEIATAFLAKKTLNWLN